MDLSLFLARLFGFYLIIVGFAYLFRQEFLKKAVREFFRNAGLILFGALLNCILGLMLVLSYNVWELNYKGFITLLNYMILLKGVSHLFFPYWGEDLWEKMASGRNLYYAGVICLLLGLWLLFRSFA